MGEYFNFTTPYKYGFQLGRLTPRTSSGKYIIVFDGEERHIENNRVEFASIDRKISFSEFQERVKGTIGIQAIYGEFEDDTFKQLYTFAKWVTDHYVTSDEDEWTNGEDNRTTEELVREYIDTNKHVIS